MDHSIIAMSPADLQGDLDADAAVLLNDEVATSCFSQLDQEVPRTEFTDWSTLKQGGFDTRTNYKYRHGRVVSRGERAEAVYIEREIVSAADWHKNVEEFERQCHSLRDRPEELRKLTTRFRRLRVTPLPGRRFEIIRKEIPVYHLDQTEPGNFRQRTQAIIQYGNIFWRPSKASSYIKRNLDPDRYDAKWFTRDFDKRTFEFEPFQFLDERKLHEHINQRNIYGVKADPQKLQWWGGADLDLHIEKGGDPDIFLRQVEAVLTFLHGRGWLICLGTDVVNGIHVIKIHDFPRPLKIVREEVQSVLNEIASLHPELEAEAIAAGMKPISQVEIYPDPNQGFRLPLGIGYTALTSRPLCRVKYHTYRGVPLYGADVVGLMEWDATEMPLEAKLQYIRDRVPRDRADASAKMKKANQTRAAQRRKEEGAVAKEMSDKKLLGSMTGRYRKVLVDFFSGRMQVPKSLQTGILLGVNALWAQGFPFEDRAEYLLGLLQDMPVSSPAFSSRLWDEDWDSLSFDINHVVESVEQLRAAPPSNNIEKSNEILRRCAAAMQQAGLIFGDPTTWERCWEENSPTSPGNSFSAELLTDDERDLIANEIAPVFLCPVDVAVEAVVKMVRLAHVKDRNGDGMSREYRRAVLADLGISCQDNRKLTACWDVVEQTGFIFTKCNHIFRKDRMGEGRARMYAVGPQVRDRFVGSVDSSSVRWPDWLIEVLHQDELSPWHEPVSAEIVEVSAGQIAKPEWSKWNESWLSRIPYFTQAYPLSHT